MPMYKCLTGSLEFSTTLGTTQESDLGERIHKRFLKKGLTENKRVITLDKHRNERYETVGSALYVMAMVAGFYKLGEREMMFLNGPFNEYMSPQILIGNKIITVPPGRVPSGHDLTRDSNDDRNHKDKFDHVSHTIATNTLPIEEQQDILHFALTNIDGGDDATGLVANESREAALLANIAQHAKRKSRPNSELVVGSFLRTTDDKGNLSGVEFNKKHFIEKNGIVYITRTLKRVASKIHLFKKDTTLSIFYSDIINMMEQMPGNDVLFRRYEVLAQDTYDRILAEGLYLDDAFWKCYMAKNVKMRGHGLALMAMDQIELMNRGTYHENVYNEVNDSAARKYGLSLYAFQREAKRREVTVTQYIKLVEKMKQVREKLQQDFTEDQVHILLSNATAYQGALSATKPELTKEKFTVRSDHLKVGAKPSRRI